MLFRWSDALQFEAFATEEQLESTYLIGLLILRIIFFLFAFIEFNPCFTIWVYHGVFTEMFPVCCLQRCLQLIAFYQYFLENRSVIWTVLGVLPNLNFFGVILKCLEDTSEEACDADGVYVVLQNQRWRESFENWWAVF